MEMQIHNYRVGSVGSSARLILSILFDPHPSKSSPLLGDWWKRAPQSAEEGSVHLDPGSFDLQLLKETLSGPYFVYPGSDTVPPCGEQVTWVVFAQAEFINVADLNVIQALFGKNPAFAGGRGNNRELRPLNGRDVFLVNNADAKNDHERASGSRDREEARTRTATAAAAAASTTAGSSRSGGSATTAVEPESHPSVLVKHRSWLS